MQVSFSIFFDFFLFRMRENTSCAKSAAKVGKEDAFAEDCPHRTARRRSRRFEIRKTAPVSPDEPNRSAAQSGRRGSQEQRSGCGAATIRKKRGKCRSGFWIPNLAIWKRKETSIANAEEKIRQAGKGSLRTRHVRKDRNVKKLQAGRLVPTRGFEPPPP